MNLQLNPNLTLYFLMISLIIGSFLNVIIYRLPRRLSFMKGFSYCPCCHHRLSSKELIPILSYLMLKGKCSHCHAVIAKRYPLIESLSLILMILCLIQADPLPERLLDYLFCCSLLCIAAIDIDTLEIDDRFHPWIIGLGFLHLTLSFHPYDRLIGFWLLFLPLALINRLFPSSIGGGDIKLAACCGFYLGSNILLGGMIAFILGGAWATLLILQNKAYPKMPIPLAPFLGIGFAICCLYEALPYDIFFHILLNS